MNRFAKDVDNCDDGVPRSLFDFLQLIGLCLGSLVLLMIALPYFTIAVAIFVAIFGVLLKRFMPASRQLKRLEGISRSPSHQLFQAVLSGMPTMWKTICARRESWEEKPCMVVRSTLCSGILKSPRFSVASGAA